MLKADMSNVVNLTEEQLLNNIKVAEDLVKLFSHDEEVIEQLLLQKEVLVSELNKRYDNKNVIVGLKSLNLKGINTN